MRDIKMADTSTPRFTSPVMMSGALRSSGKTPRNCETTPCTYQSRIARDVDLGSEEGDLAWDWRFMGAKITRVGGTRCGMGERMTRVGGTTLEFEKYLLHGAWTCIGKINFVHVNNRFARRRVGLERETCFDRLIDEKAIVGFTPGETALLGKLWQQMTLGMIFCATR